MFVALLEGLLWEKKESPACQGLPNSIMQYVGIVDKRPKGTITNTWFTRAT